MTKLAKRLNGGTAGDGRGAECGLSAVALARLLGTNRNTVMGWPAKGCPTIAAADAASGTPWRFDVAAVVAWLQQRAAERTAAPLRERIEELESALAGGAAAVGGDSEDEARRRKRNAEAALLEHRLGVERGRYFEAEEVNILVQVVCHNIKARMMAIPSRAAPYVAGETTGACQDLLDREIREALEELADAAADPLAFIKRGIAGIQTQAASEDEGADDA